MKYQEVQEQAIEILAQGAFILKTAAPITNMSNVTNATGCYYLTGENKDSYVGEAINIAKRLKQHLTKGVFNPQDVAIRYIDVQFGRKELEGFCIVNFPTNLNKMHARKYPQLGLSKKIDDWNLLQERASDMLVEAKEYFGRSKAIPLPSANPASAPGVYLIKNSKGEVLYIGETSNLAERLATHKKLAYFSALRRNIGRALLGYELITRNGKKRYFTENQEQSITNLLNECSYCCMPVAIGRLEIEEHLIGTTPCLLNRK